MMTLQAGCDMQDIIDALQEALATTPIPTIMEREKIAFIQGSSLVSGAASLMNADGTNQKLLQLTNAPHANPELSPDGRKVAYQARGHIWVADIGTNGTATNARALTTSATFAVAADPTWSPDGAHIAFEGFKQSRGKFNIYAVNVANGTFRQITGVIPNPPLHVVGNLPPNTIGDFEETSSISNDTDPDYSPDGAYIVFSTDRHSILSFGESRRTINPEIYKIRLNALTSPAAQTRMTLTISGAADRNPVWSPNGAQIAYEALPPNNPQIQTQIALIAASANKLQADQVNYLTTGLNASYPAFSRNGQRLAFVRSNNIYDIAVGDESNSNQARLLATNASQPSYGVVRETSAPTSFTISGRVLDSAGQPLPGVTITRTGNGAGATTTTRSDGKYFFTSTPRGSYTITAVRTGYTFLVPSKPVQVSNGNVTVDFQEQAIYVTVSGFVRTQAGAPVSGIHVRLTPAGGFLREGITGPDGAYSLTSISRGSYTLTPQPTGSFTFSPVSRPVVVGTSAVPNINFTAVPSVITGACTGSEGTLNAASNLTLTVKRTAGGGTQGFAGLIEAGDHEVNGDGTIQGYFGFMLNVLPASATVGRAVVQLIENPAERAGDPFGLSDSSNDLGRFFLERVTAPGGLNESPVSSSAIQMIRRNGSLYDADVTSLVQQARASNQTSISFRVRFEKLKNNNGQIDLVDFNPLQARLVICNTTPTLAPKAGNPFVR